MSKVEFFDGSTLIGTDTTSPYSITWNNAPAGSHTLTAKATATKSGSPNETHTFTYDVGANAKGRLNQVADPAATTAEP